MLGTHGFMLAVPHLVHTVAHESEEDDGDEVHGDLCVRGICYEWMEVVLIINRH